MNLRKRQRNTTTDDLNDCRINKLQHITSSVRTIDSKKYLITHFEDLSNEIIYEVLEYLDSFHIYQSFFNLNIRLRNLLGHLSIPIKIDISSFSKSQFQHYYTDFIVPIKHRMISLHISDPFTIEYIFPMTNDIFIYPQLKFLYLANIGSKYLENLLHHLTFLPNLSSLTISVGVYANKVNIYNKIFQLPMLKYCELYFEQICSYQPLCTLADTSSPIEYLIIKDMFYVNEVDILLMSLPRLRRLSMTRGPADISILILLNNSTEISFTLVELHSDNIEKFIKNHSHQIKLLHILKIGRKYNLSIETWENIILSNLSHVKIFDFKNIKDVSCCYTVEMLTSLFDNRISYIQNIRQWFFTHKYMSEENLHQIFCSIHANRIKSYRINSNTIHFKRQCHTKNVLNSVDHIIIDDRVEIKNCTKSFPNATELTLETFDDKRSRWFSSDCFHRKIPLKHLNKLNIHTDDWNLDKIINVLVHIPNIHTLTLMNMSMLPIDNLLLEKNENFHLVKKQNKIKNVIVYYPSLITVEILIYLCPELQHLTIGWSQWSLETISRLLLSETKRPMSHLSSLCVLGVDAIWIENWNTLIESNRFLADYSQKTIDRKFHLWW